MAVLSIILFLVVIISVALYAFFRSRKVNKNSASGYFMGGHSLTGFAVASTIIMTNLSTEQLVGQNGQSFVAGIQDSVIDAALLSSLQSGTTVTFPEQIDEDETAPVLDTPTITGNSTDGYTVSGTGEEPGDTVTISGEDGTALGTTTIAEDGTYSFDLAAGTVVPEEVLSLVGSDEAGNIGETVSAGQVLFVTVTDEAGNATEGIEIVVPGDDEGSAAGAGDDGEKGSSEVTKVEGDDGSGDDSGSGILPDTGVAAAPIGIVATILLAAGAVLAFFRRKPKN